MKLKAFHILLFICFSGFLMQSCTLIQPERKPEQFRTAKQLFERGLDQRELGNKKEFLRLVGSAIKDMEEKGVSPALLDRNNRYQTLAELTHMQPVYKEQLTGDQVREYISDATRIDRPEAVKVEPEKKEREPSVIILSEKRWPFGLVEIRQELSQMLEDWGEASFRVDNVLLQHVTYFYKYYSVMKPEKTNRILKRSRKYLPNIINIYSRYKLPEELGFAIPFVESSFVSTARSKVGAVGMFQFMKGTARDYGLTVRRGNDERTDYLKAAEASAKYLTRNRMVFSSIVFSIGSYHHGTGGVSSAILSTDPEEMLESANAEDRTFGPVFHSKTLGPASKEYIPQVLAAALIYRFLKATDRSSVPARKLTHQIIKHPVDVRQLEREAENLYADNPDLIGVDTTYSYYATGGYLLLCQGCKITQPAPKPKKVVKRKRKTASPKPVVKSEKVKTHKQRISGNPKFVRYTFQEGNSLEWLSSIFGISVEKIKRSPENKYLTKRGPRPGDIIRIDGLAPTTQKIGGQGYLCGKQVKMFTKKGETLKGVFLRARRLIQQTCRNSRWELGQNFSPELIKQWNTMQLGDVRESTPLDGRLPLVIYSDYRWNKSPRKAQANVQPVKPRKSTPARSFSGRRTGTIYLTYMIQDKNIAQGNVAERISEIFHLNQKELVAWNNKNRFLVQDVDSPLSWPASHRKIFIRQCPNTTQKFGGVVCGRGRNGEDTRYTLSKGQTLTEAALAMRSYLQSAKCKVEGKGVTVRNILYWNADVLAEAGINDGNDRASKDIKLVVYTDFY